MIGHRIYQKSFSAFSLSSKLSRSINFTSIKKYYFRLKGVGYQKLVIFTLLTMKMTKLFNCLGIELQLICFKIRK